MRLSDAERAEHMRLWASAPDEKVPHALCDACLEAWWEAQEEAFYRGVRRLREAVAGVSAGATLA
ncbi:MAG: hypothetical protein ACRDN9_19665 [Streptosporangiaceae bacterium]